ncbi:MAG TPA: PaaI family thioesterase [Acidimicrobiia bacterium]|nr:PaaI family thioesterase [Acidimicrobiia bacterium]
MTARPDPPSFYSLYDREPTAQVAASRRAADAARRVLRALVASDAPSADLDDAATTLGALADRLEPHAPTSRYDGTQGIVHTPESFAEVFESHPIAGPSNALAPPVHVYPPDADGVVAATATYGPAYEGPPGCVHGGVLAAAFDIVLGAASTASKRPALTGTLTVRYRRGTPINREVRYEARVDRIEPRRTHVVARAVVDGQVTAEAEGIFVRVDPDRLKPVEHDPAPGG